MLTSSGGRLMLACRVHLVAGDVLISAGASGRGQKPTQHFTARTAMVGTAVPVHSTTRPQRRPWTLLAEVASAANTVPSSQAASARGVGDMAFSAKLQGDGFVVHPAVVDCCMHVAASLNMPAEDGSPAPLRVPSSVEAYSALEEVKTGGTSASAALEGERCGETCRAAAIVQQWCQNRRQEAGSRSL